MHSSPFTHQVLSDISAYHLNGVGQKLWEDSHGVRDVNDLHTSLNVNSLLSTSMIVDKQAKHQLVQTVVPLTMAYLVIFDDLGDKVAGVCQVCHNWHPDTQDKAIGVLLQQIFNHSLNQD